MSRCGGATRRRVFIDGSDRGRENIRGNGVRAQPGGAEAGDSQGDRGDSVSIDFGAECTGVSDALGDGILQHHSGAFGNDVGVDTYRSPGQPVAEENWDAPIVVTTSVRFFESLLSNHPRNDQV